MNLNQNENPLKNNESRHSDEHRLTDRARAGVWLALAVAVFLITVATCLSLIQKSAVHDESVVTQSHVQNILYKEVSADGNTESTGESPSYAETSAVQNYLIAALNRDTLQTDAIMILNVNMKNATAAVLSIPKDTYVSGSYDIPKIKHVYGSYTHNQPQALTEACGDMLGFELDGYAVFDETALEAILLAVGGVEFDVGDAPEFNDLVSGQQTFTGAEAFEFFCYREDYEIIETDSCDLHRAFMLCVLEKLTEDPQRLSDYAALIAQCVETDISEETLLKLGECLTDISFGNLFDATLPGEAIQVDGIDYYEVDEFEACEYLNEHFNPHDSELTEDDLQFRQKHSDNGIGVDSDWNTTKATEPAETEPTEDTQELPEPTEEESSDITEETDDGELLPEPTEDSAPEDSTEPPDESTEPTENPEPLEPVEPDGDE